jgi:hypothetical protein
LAEEGRPNSNAILYTPQKSISRESAHQIIVTFVT